ncbi:uncharacterized protein LOC121329315 [Polyodon spathula]|uniref:uncharacterized protein LOC121329315 n=1 Tax=Polyodon spathula TaxID=7913 RepID=UPI001B7E5363|nr:uncharacterized protein LOC121329315 [Polyodon spathula]
MGSSMSCISHPNCRLKYSSKGFMRKKSNGLFRKKYPQEGQVKSNSIVNILCYISPKKDMSTKDLQKIESINWDQKLAYDPNNGWKKSSTSVKNFGKMIFSSPVKFRFLHCQDIHDCYLDLFQTHLHFLSNSSTGLTYQGTLPLKEINVCRSERDGEHAFQIAGSCLNSIVVYCSSEEELQTWLTQLKKQVELNGGSFTSADTKTYARLKNVKEHGKEKEELRKSVENEMIFEWEGSQRESLGQITFVTKTKMQHLPCQDQYDRLLVLYPATLIILSDEDDGLFYKGKLPLNAITVSTGSNEDNPNTFRIEGKLINPIIVTCLDQCDYQEWLRHLRALQVAVEGPPANVYDIIYTPTEKEPPRDSRVSVQSKRGSNTRVQAQKSHSWSQQPPPRDSGAGRSAFDFPIEDHEDQLMSPEYAKPFCHISSRPASIDMQKTCRLSGRSSTRSSNVQSIMEIHPPPARFSVPDRDSYASTEDPLSPVYNMPYSSLPLECPADDVSKLPLIKYNSWSTPQSSIQNHQSSVLQRYSDMCAPRKPLTPLYDDPYTPNDCLDKDTSLETECSDNHKHPALDRLDGDYALPRSFKLSTPPLGNRKRNPPLIKQEARTEPLSRQDCTRDHSTVKLLPAPPALHGCNTEKSYLLEKVQSSMTHLKGNTNLDPKEHDDLDYDNIWDSDSHRRK